MKHFCPICRRPTDSEADAEFPFCSERCRLVDLGNWATERYVVSEPVFEEDEFENLRLDDTSPDASCDNARRDAHDGGDSDARGEGHHGKHGR